MTVVFALPPRESRRSHVSLESRYGMYGGRIGDEVEDDSLLSDAVLPKDETELLLGSSFEKSALKLTADSN